MSSTRRRKSRTFDLSQMTDQQIQQLHEQFENNDENQCSKQQISSPQKSPRATRMSPRKLNKHVKETDEYQHHQQQISSLQKSPRGTRMSPRKFNKPVYNSDEYKQNKQLINSPLKSPRAMRMSPRKFNKVLVNSDESGVCKQYNNNPQESPRAVRMSPRRFNKIVDNTYVQQQLGSPKGKQTRNRRISFGGDQFDSCDLRKDQYLELDEQEDEEVVSIDNDLLGRVISFQVKRLTSYEYAGRVKLRKSLCDVRDELVEMMNNVLRQRSTNSIVLYGNRGSGKRLVVESSLQHVQPQMNQQKKQALGVVRLSGLQHNDEAIAYKEIAKQLCRQFHLEYQKFVTQTENLEFFKTVLQEISRLNGGVFFVLWNLDKFSAKGKQGLLYNLYDSLQDKKISACVIGITYQLDIDQKFEKRIRSRMAMRKVFVSTPNDVESFTETLLGMLELDAAQLGDPFQDPKFNQFLMQWNKAVKKSLKRLQVRFQSVCYCGYSVQQLARIALNALLQFDVNSAGITHKILQEALDQVIELDGAWRKVISGLTAAELVVLICICRLLRKEQYEVNFEMVHYEYEKTRQQAGAGCYLQWLQAFLSFQNLLQLGIIRRVSESRKIYTNTLLEYQLVYLHVDLEEVEKGIVINENKQYPFDHI